jgi:hypothetical protein
VSWSHWSAGEDNRTCDCSQYSGYRIRHGEESAETVCVSKAKDASSDDEQKQRSGDSTTEHASKELQNFGECVHVVERPNDPSSAIRRTGRNDCNSSAPAGFAAAWLGDVINSK